MTTKTEMEVFREKTAEYDKMQNSNEHYVQISENKVMIITKVGKGWVYGIDVLEKRFMY